MSTKLELGEELPSVVVDAIQIEQVILNLVRNSMEAMHDADRPIRELTIRTRVVDDQFVEVIVSDTGPGMDEHTQSKVFEPFVTTKEGSSMGMGLSISRSIIESHHGSLWVESKIDNGASFYFTLPVNK